jgi:hypothetical protein
VDADHYGDNNHQIAPAKPTSFTSVIGIIGDTTFIQKLVKQLS